MAEHDKDPAGKMPVHTEAGRNPPALTGPVPTSETPEARAKREREEEAPKDRKAREHAEMLAMTPAERFAKRHPQAVKAYNRALDEQMDAREELLGPRVQHLEVPRARASDDQETREAAIETTRVVHKHAAHALLGDKTTLAEMKRVEGEYPGKLFTMTDDEVKDAAAEGVDVTAHGDVLDVVDAVPRGLSSRYVPDTRTAY